MGEVVACVERRAALEDIRRWLRGALVAVEQLRGAVPQHAPAVLQHRAALPCNGLGEQLPRPLGGTQTGPGPGLERRPSGAPRTRASDAHERRGARAAPERGARATRAAPERRLNGKTSDFGFDLQRRHARHVLPCGTARLGRRWPIKQQQEQPANLHTAGKTTRAPLTLRNVNPWAHLATSDYAALPPRAVHRGALARGTQPNWWCVRSRAPCLY